MPTLNIRFSKLLRGFHHCSMTLNCKYPEAFAFYFTVVIHGLHTQIYI